MKQITYISDCGMMIQFNESFPFYLSYADLNSVGASFDEIQPSGMDGAVTQGGTYNKKIILVEGTIVGVSPQHVAELRSKLSMAMNVHHEGTLVVALDNGKKKKIRCRPNQNPYYQKMFGLGQPFTCEWQCDNPYWLNEKETIVPLGQIVPNWTFPFTPPVTFGYSVQNVNIVNDTSIEIPLKIEILTQSSLIEIFNTTTGQSCKVAMPIEQNCKMVIDGTTCDVDIINMITLERVNATNRLMAGSEYITLSPGVNHIELNNGIADLAPLSYVSYHIPSLAV